MNDPALNGFVQRRGSGRFWIGLYLVSLSVFTGLYFRLATAFETRPRFVVVNGASLLVSQELDFQDAKELHVGQAERAIQAMFSRNPSGLDRPKLLKRLLDKPSYEKLVEMVHVEAAEVEEKNLHQKVEVAEIKVLKMQNRSVEVAVTGQLIRTGHFDGRPFVEASELKATMRFTHNPALLENGLYPTVVRSFDVTITPIPLR